MIQQVFANGRRVARFGKRVVRNRIGDLQRRRRGLEFGAPNYIFAPRIKPGDVVVDVGCAHSPELALLAMERFGANVFAVDPTRKHAPALQAIQAQHSPRFTHVQVAVAATPGEITFHESASNDSGSILADHVNVRHDQTRSYEVRCVTPSGLLEEIGAKSVALMKLDLEGAEFDLLLGSQASEFAAIDQVFVEFHHVQVSRYSFEDTRRCIQRMKGFGYASFSADGVNFLFYRT
jgi:FkbM family methyltransferase